MNLYAFMASIFASLVALAWPAALIVIIFMFRKDVRRLLPHARLKHGEFEASFRLEKAEELAAELPREAKTSAPMPTPEETNRFEALAEKSPVLAIKEERAQLLDVALRRLKEANISLEGDKTLLGATRALREAGLIDEHISGILDDLRNIANVVIHDDDAAVTFDAARRFRKLSQQAQRWLRLY